MGGAPCDHRARVVNPVGTDGVDNGRRPYGFQTAGYIFRLKDIQPVALWQSQGSWE
ncbi:MAG: hypothetical protein R3C44_09640 [Chloroflexota bacterium]